ncbi:MAG: rhomboid family intramembrane serine protease [Rhodocyclaceae bacterium]|nr:rhomboid family intramembrane serine protease [Rhodocyclaceae bacterium]
MFFSIPPVTRLLIAANVVIFLGELASGNALIAAFALWPLGAGYPAFEPWQIVTYSFLHASWTHLLFNMFALFMFGGELERLFGARRYVNLYVAGVIAAALTQLAFSTLAQSRPYPTIGASGGIFGLLLTFGMYFPQRTVMLLFPPIPMPAWLFVTLYGVLELVLGVTGTQEGVAHFAHLGGMLGAWLMIRRRRR